MQFLDTLLREAPAFDTLTDEQLDLVAGCGKNVHFAQGEMLFREGEPADVFFLVRHGMLALETFVPARGPMLIETIGSGEVLGWSWLFQPYKWHFDVRAITGIRATRFDGLCLREKCDADPALGYALMQCFARVAITRLQWTRRRLVDIYAHDGDR
jgi:CRP-like cAMP-binding protein